MLLFFFFNIVKTIRTEMKIRDLEMPSNPKLDRLSSYLVEFFTKNVISTNYINIYYEIYQKFKETFLKLHPGCDKYLFDLIKQKLE